MKKYKVAVLGATGAVGQEMIKILQERQFPVSELVPLASARSVGKLIDFNGEKVAIKEAKEELNGVTLESLVVAERVARAIKVKAANGLVDLADFPLLMHIDEILTQGKEVNIPWEAFTYVQE